MKRSISGFLLFSFCAFGPGCNNTEDKKQEQVETATVADDSTKLTCNSIETGKLKTYTLDEVGNLTNKYRDLVFASYKNVTQQIRFDPARLMELACESDSLKFISIAENGQVSMAVMRGSKSKVNFYDLIDIFGKNAVCPPPDLCGLPVPVKNVTDSSDKACDSIMARYTTLDTGRIAEMAARYLQTIKKDYRVYIQQVKLEPKLLRDILCGAKSFKLIAAVREDKTITMIVEKSYGGKIAYYDIREIFGDYALCPPPDVCGLPILTSTNQK